MLQHEKGISTSDQSFINGRVAIDAFRPSVRPSDITLILSSAVCLNVI